jgi:hypothetical protein
MLNFSLQPTSAGPQFANCTDHSLRAKSQNVAVVGRPSVDTLGDGSHDGYDNEDDGYEGT